MDKSIGSPRHELDDVAIAAYQRAVRNGAFSTAEIAADLGVAAERVATAADTLWELKLLSPGGAGQPPVPVDPKLAEAELTALIERDIRQRQVVLAGMQRQLHSLDSIYASRDRASHGEQSVRTLSDPEDVRRELAAATRRCTTEVMTLQPGGGRDPLTLREALDRDLAMIQRGIRMRIIYHHTARASLATRMYVREVTQAGAQVRTADEAFERFIIFDRTVAFVPQERRRREVAPGAAIVTEPTVVGFLCRSYDYHWESSQPFDARDTQYDQMTSDLRTAIIRLLASGLKDDVIARRLGMATRTCRRHIAVIMGSMGATSRFQAGVRACILGLLPNDSPADQAVDDGPGGAA